MTTKIIHEGKDWDSLSPNAKKLVLHADECGSPYQVLDKQGALKNKGKWNKDAAASDWSFYADKMAMNHHKQYGAKDTPWDKAFSKSERKEAAKHFADSYEHHFKEEEKVNTRLYGMINAVVSKEPLQFNELFNAEIQERIVNKMVQIKEALSKKVFNKEIIVEEVKTVDTFLSKKVAHSRSSI